MITIAIVLGLTALSIALDAGLAWRRRHKAHLRVVHGLAVCLTLFAISGCAGTSASKILCGPNQIAIPVLPNLAVCSRAVSDGIASNKACNLTPKDDSACASAIAQTVFDTLACSATSYVCQSAPTPTTSACKPCPSCAPTKP